jgi:hypothetical protein
MELSLWSKVRESLENAIRASLPLQIRKANDEKIAGVGLHVDAYYGCIGLYLLPESATVNLDAGELNNIGDWPISTDWDGSEAHAQEFARQWHPWEEWFRDHLDGLTDAELDQRYRGLLRAACEAMQKIESDGLLDNDRRTDDFRIIIIEHDEPDEMGLERYELFCRTGMIRCYGDDG